MPARLGIRFLAFALALTALLAVPSAATPAGQITIYGAASGTHMTVTEEDGRLVVRGPMEAAHPHGCRLSADQMEAICRLAGTSAVEITLGDSGDFLQIVSPLPVPVTAYLGDGSDKMIGNAEPDTCYSEGARRNRCIGGGGDDVCITGEKNSDCVGDAGNDYCETRDGSDGCWGGDGDDICKMGPGMDGCHGEGGNDYLYGGANPDQLYGGVGWDYCDGGPGRGKSHSCDAGPRN
jgi:Ca2+-binding RTX toxin-like protein